MLAYGNSYNTYAIGTNIKGMLNSYERPNVGYFVTIQILWKKQKEKFSIINRNGKWIFQPYWKKKSTKHLTSGYKQFLWALSSLPGCRLVCSIRDPAVHRWDADYEP